jgi:PAS domain-containing protein
VTAVRRRWLLLLVFLAALAFYVPQTCPTVGYVDAPRYVRKAVQLELGIRSIDHPLFMVVAHGFAGLPLGGNPAWRVNLVSAVFGALTVALLFGLVSELAGGPWWGLLGAGAALTMWNLWWSSTEAEVYTLNAAFLVGILWAMLRASRSGDRRYLVLALFLHGLGLVNHQMLVLLLPGMLLLALLTWRGRWRELLDWRLAAAWLTGFSLYLALVVRELFHRPAPEVLSLITGGEFSGRMLQSGGLAELVEYGIRFVAVMLASLDLLYVLLALYGIRQLFRDERRYAWFLAVDWLVMTFFFVNYRVPDRFFFYLPSFLVAIPFTVAGAQRAWSRWGRRRLGRWMLIAALVFPVVGRPMMYAAAVDAVREIMLQLGEQLTDAYVPHIAGRDDYRYYVYPSKRGEYSGDRYRRLMESAPRGAVIIDDWYHGYAIMKDYFQDVLGVRRDLVILRWFEVFGGTEEDKRLLVERIERLLREREVLLTHREYPVTTLLERLRARGPLRVEPWGEMWRLSRPAGSASRSAGPGGGGPGGRSGAGAATGESGS